MKVARPATLPEQTAACELLGHLLDGASPGSSRVPMLGKVPPKRVIARKSTATFNCDHPGVTAAALYIREHFHEDITVAGVARHVGMSMRSLQAEYPLRVGRTVKDDIIWERLKCAQGLLATTNLKVVTIATKAGFGTSAHFCHLFHRAFHLTPLEWRRQERGRD
jgi:LacI family transcriptional regulator